MLGVGDDLVCDAILVPVLERSEETQVIHPTLPKLQTTAGQEQSQVLSFQPQVKTRKDLQEVFKAHLK